MIVGALLLTAAHVVETLAPHLHRREIVGENVRD
jgi:hypothetical protein